MNQYASLKALISYETSQCLHRLYPISCKKKHVEWASVSAAAITETLTEAINETCFEGTVRPSL